MKKNILKNEEINKYDNIIKYLNNIRIIVENNYKKDCNLEIKLSLESCISCKYELLYPPLIAIDMEEHKDDNININLNNFKKFINKINEKLN